MLCTSGTAASTRVANWRAKNTIDIGLALRRNERLPVRLPSFGAGRTNSGIIFCLTS
jgi:hypothetical protein